MTLPGVPLLTLGYGAPEQEVDASQVDERADIYALGGTLWFLLTGQNPRYFRESEVPEPLREIVVKALEKDREKRFQTAADLEQALATLNPHGDAPLPAAKRSGLVPGRCPECGHQHLLDLEELRKCRFCESCGVSLFEPCLECGRENGVWSKFCNSCGADVKTVLQEVANRLHADRQRIMLLRSELYFEEAISLLERMMVDVSHPRLSEFVQWASESLLKMKNEFSAAACDRDRTLQSAKAEILGHNYEAGVALLEALPLPLRTARCNELLLTAQARIDESATLREEIAAQAKSGQHKGLKAKVLRFLELRPGSKMQKLLEQIEQREAREHERLWKSVKRQPSLAAYEHYLAVYPNGSHAATAQERIAQCKTQEHDESWETINSQPNNVAAWRHYLEKHPNGPYVEQARSVVAPVLREQLLGNLRNVALRRDYLDKRTPALAVEDEHLARNNARIVSTIAALAGGVLLGAFVGGLTCWFFAIPAGLVLGIAVHFLLNERLRRKMTNTMARAVGLVRRLPEDPEEDGDLMIGSLTVVICLTIWFVAATTIGLVAAFSRNADEVEMAAGAIVGALTAAAMAVIVFQFVKGYGEKGILGPLPWFDYFGRLGRLRAKYLGASVSTFPVPVATNAVPAVPCEPVKAAVVEEPRTHREVRPLCQHCGKPLETAGAQHCLECGAGWLKQSD